MIQWFTLYMVKNLFLGGKFIRQNTRLIFDLKIKCEIQNSNWLIVLIDFEETFDSIS